MRSGSGGCVQKCALEPSRPSRARFFIYHAVFPRCAVDGFCAEESEDEDEEKTEKQVMKEKVYGERKSGREKKPEPLVFSSTASSSNFPRECAAQRPIVSNNAHSALN